MNRDTLEGKWKQLKGKFKEKWGRLTDDELDRTRGKYDQVIGTLQEKYGHSRERAQQEVDAFLEECNC